MVRLVRLMSLFYHMCDKYFIIYHILGVIHVPTCIQSKNVA